MIRPLLTAQRGIGHAKPSRSSVHHFVFLLGRFNGNHAIIKMGGFFFSSGTNRGLSGAFSVYTRYKSVRKIG